MTKYLLEEIDSITARELAEFTRQSINTGLTQIRLANRIMRQWQNRLNQQLWEVWKDRQSFPHRNWKSPGVYVIYNRPKHGHRTCFYVGKSRASVCDRIKTHVRGDVEDNYGEVFEELAGQTLYIGYAHVQPNNMDAQALDRRLRLLEHFLTTMLRPRFFTR